MPRNGLNESTSLRSATVKVTFSSAALRGAAGREREPGRQAAEQQTERRRRRAREYVDARDRACPARRAPREPFEHTEHGVARPDPYHWMHGDTPALTEHLSAERSFYDSSVAHLHPLVSTLKAEMFSRLPPAEVSARWRRTRFSYYTVHPAGNDYAHIVREIHGFETDSKQISPVLGRSADENRIDGRRCCSTSGRWPTTAATSSSG